MVAHRLAALAKRTDLRIVQPVPHFPLVRSKPQWLNRKDLTLQGVPVDAVPMLSIPRAFRELDGRWLARCTRKRLIAFAKRHWRADVIDAHFGYPDGVGCARAAMALGLPFFITIRGSEINYLNHPKIAPQLLHALKMATGCISVSHSLRRLVVHHGIDADKVRVIHNAVDRSIFRPGPKDEARSKLGVKEEIRLIVSVGHVVPVKRHDVLIQAVHRVIRQYPSARLVIIGGCQPSHRMELWRLVNNLGLQRHVRFLDVLDQETISCWLRAADAFALATMREGCCNAVIEALATGTPVVTTPAGDNAHFVHDNENGFIIPMGNVEACARALADALDRVWDPAAISCELKVGSWDDVAEATLEFFVQRLQNPGSGGPTDERPAVSRAPECSV